MTYKYLKFILARHDIIVHLCDRKLIEDKYINNVKVNVVKVAESMQCIMQTV